MKRDEDIARTTEPLAGGGTPPPRSVVLASGEAISLTPEVVAELEYVVRAWRRSNAARRDLAAEIHVLLSERPGASTLEIARAIRARDCDVRRVLNADTRFQRLSGAAGPWGRGNGWIVPPTASGLVPEPGTSSLRDETDAS